jgi:hypothetical protein
LTARAARFAPAYLRADLSGLSSGDRQALLKLLEAARILDDVYLDQCWSKGRAFYRTLQQDASGLGRARQHYYWINKGPWDALDNQQAFLPGAPGQKPAGANLYPEDMTKAEFEKWLATLAGPQRDQATGFFTAIRRNPDGQLSAVPYSVAYRADLTRAAQLLREAAALTGNSSLKQFLNLRAEALLSNQYYPSDLAWMALDAPLDITLGPYETYIDELFGYKAAFEAYISLRDERETARLAVLASHLQEIEDHLPEDPQYRNPRLGPAAPIRVVNQIFASGDAAHGVLTAAYNLPNDERVVRERGSKRVLLKNVQEAKFRAVLLPVAMRVLAAKAQPDVSFDMFFLHILAHELMHGLGPHQIVVNGRATNVRLELKDVYGPIEEAKADVTGLFAVQYLMEHAAALRLEALFPTDEAAQRQLYLTYLASAFRSLRFGLNDAHGKGMAMQFNYLLDRGAIREEPDGAFTVNVSQMKSAVRELAHVLLTLEATGDYAGARNLLDSLGIIRPGIQRLLQTLEGVPVDIEPIYATADELTHPPVAVKTPPPRPRRSAGGHGR